MWANGIEVTEREYDLLVRCRKRDRRAQNAFYQEHFAYLMKLALRYAVNRDQAVEWVNLGFARIFVQLDKFNPELELHPWMATVLRNIILDELRKESRHRKHTAEPDVEEFREFGSDDTPLGQGEEFEEQVRLALEALHLFLCVVHMARQLFALLAQRQLLLAEILEAGGDGTCRQGGHDGHLRGQGHRRSGGGASSMACLAQSRTARTRDGRGNSGSHGAGDAPGEGVGADSMRM